MMHLHTPDGATVSRGAAVWVAECEYFEESTQVRQPLMENSLNAGGGQNLNK